MAVDLAAEFIKNDSPRRPNGPPRDPIFTIQARIRPPRLRGMGWIDDMNGIRGSLYFRVMPPGPALKPFVRYYWVLKCPADAPRVDEFLAPDGFEELIFSYGGSYRRDETLGGRTRSAVIDGSYLVGCKSAGVTCARLGSPLNMIGIKFWPQSLYALLRTPLSEYGSTSVPLRELPAGPLRDLESRLHDCAGEDDIRDTLDACLSNLPLMRSRSDLVDYSLRRIFARRGDIQIDELTNDTSAHYRTVEKRFAEHVGIAPKTLAKTIRFKHAMHLLQGARAMRTPLTRLADLGYYDQSHFAKDFHYFTGSTPGKFLKSRSGLSIDVFRFCLDLDLNDLDAHSGPGFIL